MQSPFLPPHLPQNPNHPEQHTHRFVVSLAYTVTTVIANQSAPEDYLDYAVINSWNRRRVVYMKVLKPRIKTHFFKLLKQSNQQASRALDEFNVRTMPRWKLPAWCNKNKEQMVRWIAVLKNRLSGNFLGVHCVLSRGERHALGSSWLWGWLWVVPTF